MLSKASKYAITAVLYLINKSSRVKKVGSKEIAKELDLPAPFLAKTLQELTKNKIISSVKGPHGGFYLSTENKKNTLFDIINCIDDISKFNLCYLGKIECNEEKPCAVHYLYAPFKNKLIEELKTKTILEISTESRINNSITKII